MKNIDLLRNRIKSIILADSITNNVKIEKLLALIYEEQLKNIIELKEKLQESEVQN